MLVATTIIWSLEKFLLSLHYTTTEMNRAMNITTIINLRHMVAMIGAMSMRMCR